MSMKRRLVVNSEVRKSADKKVCLLFKRELITFVEKLDELLKTKDLCQDVQFLDALADLVLEIDRLSLNARGCGEDLEIAAGLVQNMLTTELNAPCEGMTLLSAACEYKDSKTSSKTFGHIMNQCFVHHEDTTLLLSSLKLIADEI